MVLVAASLGLVLYSVAGISGSESAIVALTALTFLILYNAVSMRLRDRTDVGSQIADLSRGTADLARQVAEFGRRLAAVEGRVVSANSAGADRIQAVVGEINELGVLVKQLAVSVASHDDMLSSGALAAAPAAAGKPDNEQQTDLPFSAENTGIVASAVAPACCHRGGPRPPQSGANPRRREKRGGGKPDRYLSAADGDLAAAQGALLRGGDAAARRQGSASRRRRFHRGRGSSRADRADRSHGDAALRAGAAPADGAQQGGRGILQRRRGDARQSDHLRAMPRFPRGQSRAGAVLRARIQAGDVSQSGPSRNRTSRGFGAARLPFLDRSRQRSQDRAARTGRPRRPLHQGARGIAARSKADLGVRHSSIRPFGSARPLRHRSDRRTDRRRTRGGRSARL